MTHGKRPANFWTHLVAVCLSFFLLGAAHSTAWGCGAAARIDTGSAFMVSAVLRLKGSGVVIKLVHSRVVASNADEATALLLRGVTKDYPGYSVLSTLTTELEEKPAACVPQRTLNAMATGLVRV